MKPETRKFFELSLMMLFMLLSLAGYAQSKAANVQQKPTGAWGELRISPKINVNVKDEVKQVHFIQTNNDPYVYTKTYELKYADPYATRDYLLNAVQSLRVNTNDTRVECIKYNDGGGLVLVAAEAYRFNEKQNGGMTIDELVASLDMPKLSSVPGTRRYMYFPKYVASAELQRMLQRVGLNSVDAAKVSQASANSDELEIGKDVTDVDDGLNGLFFFIPDYNLKTVVERLNLYDTAPPEALIKATVYEIHAENDGKMGADFQSWKNGPGADFFSIGGRWRDNMSADGASLDGSGNSSTKYVKFNPKWNSKYLDFISAEGNAKILTYGELTVKNRVQATIAAKTQIPYFDTSVSTGTGGFGMQYDYETGSFYPAGTTVDALSNITSNCYMISAYDSNGSSITIDNAYNGNFLITEYGIGSDSSSSSYYTLSIPCGKANFFKDGKNMGTSVNAERLEIMRISRGANSDNRWTVYTPTWQTDLTGNYEKGPKVTSKFATLTAAGSEYGFQLKITPVITEKATKLELSLENSSLTGFQSSGAVRLSTSSLNTEIMLDNDNSEVIIGGIEKKTVERGVSKIPWLGSIPGMGWLFGSEYEDTKKSQIVTVIQCMTLRPSTAVSGKPASDINEVKNSLTKAGQNDIDNPDYGYNQFYLDKDKKKMEKLP